MPVTTTSYREDCHPRPVAITAFQSHRPCDIVDASSNGKTSPTTTTTESATTLTLLKVSSPAKTADGELHQIQMSRKACPKNAEENAFGIPRVNGAAVGVFILAFVGPGQVDDS